MSSDNTLLKNIIKKYVISIFSGLAFFLLGVAITAIILFYTSTDSRLIFYIPYIFIAIGGLISSKFLYKNSSNRGFEAGIKAGVLYSLLLFLISYLFCFNISAFSLLMGLVAVLSCVVGGVLAANSRK